MNPKKFKTLLITQEIYFSPKFVIPNIRDKFQGLKINIFASFIVKSPLHQNQEISIMLNILRACSSMVEQ
jgi:hypothetical protein